MERWKDGFEGETGFAEGESREIIDQGTGILQSLIRHLMRILQECHENVKPYAMIFFDSIDIESLPLQTLT